MAVVFVTACSDLETFHAAAEAGFWGYVLKPRLCTDLVPAINLALNGTRFVSPWHGVIARFLPIKSSDILHCDSPTSSD